MHRIANAAKAMWPKLQECCTASVEGLIGNEDYRFIDNNSRILAIAHCDTVCQENWFSATKVNKETLVFSPKLDDRLGVFTIMNLLPKLGVSTDVLLTDYEEFGQSTAKEFEPPKKYNWIVEFDRKGHDAVTYEYDEMEEYVKKYFRLGFGTFSDISVMENLGVGAFNVGVGYYDEHSPRSYFVVQEYIAQIARFLAFYEDMRETCVPHVVRQFNWWRSLEEAKYKYVSYGRKKHDPTVLPWDSQDERIIGKERRK